MSITDWPIAQPPHPDAVDHFDFGPAPLPPLPMTEEVLTALEAMAAGTAPEPWLMASDAELATTIPALIAEIRRLRAESHHECGLCHEVGPCEPHGYDWYWRCEDWGACDSRFRALHPTAYKE